MPNDSNEQASRKPEARSQVTNGSRLLPELDGRSVWARRARDLIEAHSTDLGGVDRLSEAQRSLIRRASALQIKAEQIELRMAHDTATQEDIDTYLRIAGVLKRIFDTIGLERRPRDTAPDLRAYLEATQKDSGNG